MSPVPSTIPTYLDCYAAQVGALGIDGQERLQRSSVLVAGLGGVGTVVSSILGSSGVGRLILLDPQTVELENFNRYPFARRSDVGRPKADVVAGFFEGRPHLEAIPVIATAEAFDVREVGNHIDLIVSASNTMPSRLAIARLARRLGVPVVAAGVTDGRDTWAGMVTLWVPEVLTSACPACFLAESAAPERGESLLASVVAVVASVAAHLVVEVLIRVDRGRVVEAGNCVDVDVIERVVQSFRVSPRPECSVCGRQASTDHE